MLLMSCSYEEDTALTCGKAIAAIFAHSKGRAIGVFESQDKDHSVRNGHSPVRDMLFEICYMIVT